MCGYIPLTRCWAVLDNSINLSHHTLFGLDTYVTTWRTHQEYHCCMAVWLHATNSMLGRAGQFDKTEKELLSLVHRAPTQLYIRIVVCIMSNSLSNECNLGHTNTNGLQVSKINFFDLVQCAKCTLQKIQKYQVLS